MGLLTLISNAELAVREQTEIDAERQQEAIESALVAHIRRCWERNKQAKETVEKIMLQCLRQRVGEYDPDTLQAIKNQGGSEIYMMLTATKCRAAASWLTDILLPAGERPWGITPTPVPDLPPALKAQIEQRLNAELNQFFQQTGQKPDPNIVQQRHDDLSERVLTLMREQADKRAEAAEELIADQLEEGTFASAMSEFIDDFVTFPAAILKAPVLRKRKRFGWSDQGPRVTETLVYEDERVSPFDVYPSPGAITPNDGEFIEVVRYTQSQLANMQGVPGFRENGINLVLEEGATLKEWMWNDIERERLERWGYNGVFREDDGLIEGLHFWGCVSGKMLEEWGLEIENNYDYYEIEAILIGRHLIRVEFNADPLGRRPYYKSSFYRVPGAFWGMGPPQLMRDTQRMCNATARALSNNMGIASGPQVMVLTDRIAEGGDIVSLYPWKIWQGVSDPMGGSSTQPPVAFFQPSSNAQELLGVYEQFERRADDESGIPRYSYGNERVGGAGQTAQGLAMLMDAAGKGIKDAVRDIDEMVMRPRIERQYHEILLYHPDPSVKGDVRVVARGASAILVKGQQQLRRNEFLAMTANPIDMQIIGLEGRAKLLRGAAKDMGFEDIVPEQIEPPAPQAPQEDPAKQQEMALKAEMHQASLADKDRERKLKAALAQMNAKNQRDMKAADLNTKITEMQLRRDTGAGI